MGELRQALEAALQRAERLAAVEGGLAGLRGRVAELEEAAEASGAAAEAAEAEAARLAGELAKADAALERAAAGQAELERQVDAARAELRALKVPTLFPPSPFGAACRLTELIGFSICLLPFAMPIALYCYFGGLCWYCRQGRPWQDVVD
mmetsp:Transcript_13810/g.34848  ORF Transcript_13810/g.34848 Transcript_13810/m.34848 type:complete len:150 (-) Transcript_13810:754-1203(-)